MSAHTTFSARHVTLAPHAHTAHTLFPWTHACSLSNNGLGDTAKTSLREAASAKTGFALELDGNWARLAQRHLELI